MDAVTDTAQTRWVRQHLSLLTRAVAPETARHLARLTADTIAIAHYARTHKIGATAFDETGLADGDVAIWGSATGRHLLDAAFLNGSAAEALDFQEVLIDGRNNGHAAVVIVPALLALAKLQNLSGEKLCRGLWIAFAANIALARALGRGHRTGESGFRTTSLTAPVAAALGGALMITGEQDTAARAVGISAASLPAGLLAAMSPRSADFSVDKDLSVGFSARHAVHAILLAQAGATGPADVLTGPKGWIASYGHSTEDAAVFEQPVAADISAYALKYYPANFGCQCAIGLAIGLADKVGAEDVSGLTVSVKSSSAASLATRNLRTHVAARFSLAYAVASAFVRKRSVLADFEGEAINHPAVRAFMEKVEIVGSEALEVQHQRDGTFPARISIRKRNGMTLEGAMERPDERFTADEADDALSRKFEGLCPTPLANALKDLVRKAERPELFGDFLSLRTNQN